MQRKKSPKKFTNSKIENKPKYEKIKTSNHCLLDHTSIEKNGKKKKL